MGTAGIEVIGATRSEKIELGDLAPEIYEDWAHSHEEDTDEVEVYRPRDFDFPPSWPRAGFEIKENGEFQEFVPAPDDRGVVPGRAGYWRAVGRNIIRVRFDDPEAEPYTLRIESVEEGVLRIKRETIPSSHPGPLVVRAQRARPDSRGGIHPLPRGPKNACTLTQPAQESRGSSTSSSP